MPTGDRPDPLAEPEGYGTKPGQPEQAVVPDHCQHQGGKCTHRVHMELWLGDINEHVWPLYACFCCFMQIRNMPMTCTVCQAKVMIIRSDTVSHLVDCSGRLGADHVQSALDRL